MRRRRLVVGLASILAAGCSAGRPTATPAAHGGTIGDQPCPPPFETGRDRAVCSHTVDPATEPVFLRPDPEQVVLDSGRPAGSVRLTLHNQSDDDLEFNPASWAIWRRALGDWRERPPEIAGDGRLVLPAGETHEWTLVDAVGAIIPDPRFEAGLHVAVLDVPDPTPSADLVACIGLVDLGRP